VSPAPRVGISACLLGQPVRWNGGHKHAASLVDDLGRFVEWLPVCPEVELGMGVPRPPVRLVHEAGVLHMIESDTNQDHTQAMRDYAQRRVAELANQNLCGYILKKDSPSCGLEDVEVHRIGAPVTREGRGLFAEALLAALPSLPVADEGQLQDLALRKLFVERLFAYQRRIKD
jgi:uncharacterized protein YbbK (DUF523 family)